MTTAQYTKRLKYWLLTASLFSILPGYAQGPLDSVDFSNGLAPVPFIRGGSSLTDPSKVNPVESDEDLEKESKDTLSDDANDSDTGKEKEKKASSDSDDDESEEGTAKENQKTLLESERNLIKAAEQDLGAKTHEDPTITLNRVKLLMKKGHYTLALKEVNKCLTYDKNNWTARLLGAMCLQAQGRNREAIVRFKEYLAHTPDDVEANINIGTIYRAEEEYEEAAKHYRKAIAKNFYSLEAHYNLANVLMDEGNLREAIKELRICLKLNPKNAKVHNNVGVLFLKRGYYEDALDEFTRASRLDPANKDYQNNLAAVKLKMKAQK